MYTMYALNFLLKAYMAPMYALKNKWTYNNTDEKSVFFYKKIKNTTLVLLPRRQIYDKIKEKAVSRQVDLYRI